MKKTIKQLISEGQTLISDGAWGTFLQAKGLKAGECPEMWNIINPDAVFDIAKSLIQIIHLSLNLMQKIIIHSF